MAMHITAFRVQPPKTIGTQNLTDHRSRGKRKVLPCLRNIHIEIRISHYIMYAGKTLSLAQAFNRQKTILLVQLPDIEHHCISYRNTYHCTLVHLQCIQCCICSCIVQQHSYKKLVHGRYSYLLHTHQYLVDKCSHICIHVHVIVSE